MPLAGSERAESPYVNQEIDYHCDVVGGYANRNVFINYRDGTHLRPNIQDN